MSRETKPVSFAGHRHPDEDRLLLALECELLLEESQRVEQHLGKCWSCRARFDEMQRGILAFVEYREKRYLPSLLVPPDDSSGFRNRLRDLLCEVAPVDWSTRLRRKFAGFFAAPRHVSWVSAVAMGMVAVMLWVHVFVNPAAVCAAELLTRAVASQNPEPTPQKGTQRRVARQKVQIRRGNRTVVRNFEWKLDAPIEQAHWGEQPDLVAWNAPMTAEGFAHWRNSLSSKEDKVKRSGNLLTLDTTTDLSRIKQAWIVVRADDFHPVEQHLIFTDDQQLDFKELSFQIVEGELPAIRPTLQTVSPSKGSAPVPSAPAADLDEAELQLRYALFENQWDLGEDLIVGRYAGSVTLSGIVSSLERGKAMQAALNKLPNVQLSIDMPSPLNVPTAGSTRALAPNDATPSSTPLLKEVLQQAFASREERLAFVDRCLATSGTALSHAWSLRRLVDRYTDPELKLLKPESDTKLRKMLRSHLDELDDANRDLASLLELLPGSETRTAAIPTDHRTRIASLLAAVQEQDSLVASLVVGSETEGRSIASASADLRSAHEAIDKLLGRLRELAGDPAVK